MKSSFANNRVGSEFLSSLVDPEIENATPNSEPLGSRKYTGGSFEQFMQGKDGNAPSLEEICKSVGMQPGHYESQQRSNEKILMRGASVAYLNFHDGRNVSPLTASDSADPTKKFEARITGPVKFLKHLAEAWQLEEVDLCSLLGFERSQLVFVRSIMSGVSSLQGNDPKARIAILFEIRKTLDALLRDPEVERRWIRERKIPLGNRSPLELLLDETPASMENLLTVREFINRIANKP